MYIKRDVIYMKIYISIDNSNKYEYIYLNRILLENNSKKKVYNNYF